MLTISAARAISEIKVENNFSDVDEAGRTGTFLIRTETSSKMHTLKFDHIRPFGSRRRLSLGGKVEHVRTDVLTEHEGASPTAAIPLSGRTEIDGSWLETSAYLTYQAPLLGGTLLAGLRVEGRRYSFAGRAPIQALRRSDPFPSLHFERVIAKWLTADLSYSRRIAWPDIESLNPALRFSDPTTANAGNSALRPELTDSLEVKLKARLSGQEIDLTGFHRRTTNVLSILAELGDDGVLVAKPVNLGSRTLHGASFSMRGSLGGGFRYSLAGNLADQSFSLGEAQAPLPAVGAEYGLSARLEYRDGVEGRRGTDRFVLNARYRGPTSSGFFRISDFATGDASWSHAFTDRLSSVLTIADVFGSPRVRSTSYSGTTLSREVSRTDGPRITLSLTYSLSPPPKR